MNNTWLSEDASHPSPSASPTPGPWRAQDNGVFYQSDGWRELIASTSTERSQWRANARLIAAAPDLLAALKKLTAFVGNMSFHPKAEDRHADDLVDAAETAIARAEGL